MSEKRALTLEDLYQQVPMDDEVSYIDYWIKPDKSLVDQYVQSHQVFTGCSSQCVTCQITHIDKYKELCPDTPKQSYQRMRTDKKAGPSHAWQIQCPFIPEDYETSIPGVIRSTMSPEEIAELKIVNDPVAFAAKYFKWYARAHQALMLRCQSKKKVLRWGRRGGKSESFAIEILWHALTKNVRVTDPDTGEVYNSGLKILIVAPFESQVINIFEMLNKFIERSEEVSDTVVKYRKSPHHHLEFKNGCTIKGFTTGANEAASIRGQDAHILILDECDYMSEGDYRTVMPITQSHPNVLVRASSTPQGKRERFWFWSTQNPQWKEFYFPSAIIDKTPFSQSQMRWKDMRKEMRPEHSHDSWLQEVMAVFVASATGVYQPGFIADAMKDYTYEMIEAAKLADAPELAGWRYSFGVDWNSNAGTEICVMGLNPNGRGFQVMTMVNVPKQEFTQYKGLSKITEMFKLWKPDHVYVDAGHGATNWEMLRLWAGQQAPGSYERGLERKIKKYEFGGKVEIRDPATRKLVKHPAKAYMVENSVRKFEDRAIIFSKDDEVLRRQLLNYIVQSRSESGKPIYGFENKALGDHRLDALNLALVAWALEEGTMARFSQRVLTEVGFLGSPAHQMVSQAKQEEESPYDIVDISARRALKESLFSRHEAISQRNDKMYEGQEPAYLQATHIDRPGFLNDTEHLYDAKRARKQESVRHINRRKAPWKSRSI